MKTDPFWLSALWGRLGAAIVLIIGTSLQQMGVTVTSDQMAHANTLIGTLIGNIHIVLAAGLVIWSKLRERSRLKPVAVAQASAPAASNQSGLIRMAPLAVLLILCLAAAGLTVSGCATKSATQQIMSQTSDPATIALATYADAQDAYIAAQEIYKPYHAAIRAQHPDLDAKIIDLFRRANTILDKWKLAGSVPAGDETAFRDYLRQISLQVAQSMQAK